MALSDKLRSILRSKGSFSDSELALMTEAEGWRWVYSQPTRTNAHLNQICFTGFTVEEKAELSALATAAGLEVVQSVTKRLSILCVGSEPGPSKLAKAREQRVRILDRRAFEEGLARGEFLPLAS